jgi:predicted DNA-binding ribbon-helix-helix protein
MTPLRSIRIDAELWQSVKEKARNEGTTATAIIINALREYIK